jgi:transposase-like protein
VKTYVDALHEFQAQYWKEAFEQCQSVAEVSRKSGVNRTDIYKKMSKLGLHHPVRRPTNRGNPEWQDLARLTSSDAGSASPGNPEPRRTSNSAPGTAGIRSAVIAITLDRIG